MLLVERDNIDSQFIRLEPIFDAVKINNYYNRFTCKKQRKVLGVKLSVLLLNLMQCFGDVAADPFAFGGF